MARSHRAAVLLAICEMSFCCISLATNLQLGLGGSSAANQMSTCDLVAAANRFVALLPTSNQTALLRVRQPKVLNFSEATFPRRLQGKPVF